ncbi:MAG: hypothetical protein GQ553_00545 [Nitrosomonadaceae bacterium]|nr:hypothetical protein [Nitrosomonadaceae bacterium]
MAKKAEKVATIRANPDFKGTFRPGTMRAAYAERMASLSGQPLSAFVDSVADDCPALTKKNTAEPVKGWITYLTGENGPFLVS